MPRPEAFDANAYPPEYVAELDRRAAEALADPSSLTTWADVEAILDADLDALAHTANG